MLLKNFLAVSRLLEFVYDHGRFVCSKRTEQFSVPTILSIHTIRGDKPLAEVYRQSIHR